MRIRVAREPKRSPRPTFSPRRPSRPPRAGHDRRAEPAPRGQRPLRPRIPHGQVAGWSAPAYLGDPDAKPFVELAPTVKSGDKLMLVEAMKTSRNRLA